MRGLFISRFSKALQLTNKIANFTSEARGKALETDYRFNFLSQIIKATVK